MNLFIITYLNINKTFHLNNRKSTWSIMFHNWLLNTASVNLIENVFIIFLKNVIPTVSFSVTTDAALYF